MMGSKEQRLQDVVMPTVCPVLQEHGVELQPPLPPPFPQSGLSGWQVMEGEMFRPPWT